MRILRRPGAGWIALLGGGEFSYGETEEADRAWLARTPPGTVGFLPTASGSIDYASHFAAYLESTFGRTVENLPIYRPRDARRDRNRERLLASAGIYLGGGVTDRLLEVLAETPCGAALDEKLEQGGMVAAIAAGAQALGQVARSLQRGQAIPALGWLPHGAIEANFDPAHDRRLRQLLLQPEITWGLGLPAGSAVLLGPEQQVEVVGPVFGLDDPEGDLKLLRVD